MKPRAGLLCTKKQSDSYLLECLYNLCICFYACIQRDSGINLVWHLEGSGSGSTKFRFFQANFREMSNFSGNFTQNFVFSRQIFERFRFFRQFKKIDFPCKICLFTATSGQIILFLFLFKSHQFRTYVLYMIRYNNILRPPQRPPDPLSKIWGSRPPTFRIDAPTTWCRGVNQLSDFFQFIPIL